MFRLLHGSLSPIAVVLALASGSAWAQDWSSFEGAFPTLPCHDGWAACVVDGARVSPDMADAGPSNMRIDWFELTPTRSFSPFSGLSEYTGEVADAGEPAVAAAVDPEPGSMEDDGVAAAPSKEAVQAERAADEAAAAQAAAEASEEEARRQQKEAEAASRQAQQAAQQATAEEAKRRKEAERLAAQAAQAESAEQDKLRKEAEAARKAAEDAERKRKEAERQEAEMRAAQAAAQKQAEAEERKRRDAAAAAAAAEAESRARAEEDRQRREAEDAARRAEQERLAAEKAEKAEKERQAAAAKAEAERAEAERKAADAAAAAAASQAAAQADKANEEAAAKAAADQAEAERLAAAEAEATDAAAAADVAPPPAMGDDTCDNLQALEPSAMLGKLSAGQAQCLESSLASAPKMTDRKKISVLLMTNAFSKGDKKAWEGLVKRHLDEIDQSDPDLCYKYALYLAGMGPSRASGVIRWANVALENRTVWTGDTYKSRVNSLYKMRAASSQKLWKVAEQEHAASPSDATSSKIDKYRNMTKVNAREWYEYAKLSGKDTTKPLQLCMSAAGTADYCDAG